MIKQLLALGVNVAQARVQLDKTMVALEDLRSTLVSMQDLSASKSGRSSRVYRVDHSKPGVRSEVGKVLRYQEDEICFYGGLETVGCWQSSACGCKLRR